MVKVRDSDYDPRLRELVISDRDRLDLARAGGFSGYARAARAARSAEAPDVHARGRD